MTLCIVIHYAPTGTNHWYYYSVQLFSFYIYSCTRLATMILSTHSNIYWLLPTFMLCSSRRHTFYNIICVSYIIFAFGFFSLIRPCSDVQYLWLKPIWLYHDIFISLCILPLPTLVTERPDKMHQHLYCLYCRFKVEIASGRQPFLLLTSLNILMLLFLPTKCYYLIRRLTVSVIGFMVAIFDLDLYEVQDNSFYWV